MNKDIELFYRELRLSRVPLIVRQIDEENVFNINELRHTNERRKKRKFSSSQTCTDCKRQRKEVGVVLTDAFNHNDILVEEQDLRHFAESVKEAINQRREETRVVHFISQEMEIDQRL